MSKVTLWFLVGALGFASCSITCPDGETCPDSTTCCQARYGYGCCPLPNAVCCSDRAHCCPSGHRCNLAAQKCEKVVYCDKYTYCPDGTTCCRHPKGIWTCCPYSPGKCCLDGFHCCPYGYDCDYTYTYCVKERLAYPFLRKPALPSVPASLIPTSEDNEN